jgi:hypothetical protein
MWNTREKKKRQIQLEKDKSKKVGPRFAANQYSGDSSQFGVSLLREIVKVTFVFPLICQIKSKCVEAQQG